MAKSKIEWTEQTWNPITGCTKVSAGCKNCYAETIANRFWGERKFTDIVFHEDRLTQPLRWKKPRMVFVNSMSDLFHKDIPDIFIAKIFGIMAQCKQHIFQVLTKRPEEMLNMLKFGGMEQVELHFPHVWLGVSVENQKTADERIPLLLQTPAKIRWLSIEPMLEEIDLTSFFLHEPYPDWVVVGAESGHKKRQCKTEWIKSIVNQCKLNNVPVFVKQIQIVNEIVKDIERFPEGLKIREYPYLTAGQNRKTMNKQNKILNDKDSSKDNKPICDTCKKPIKDSWADFEKFRYKTINGNIKEVWCCFDCQLNME